MDLKKFVVAAALGATVLTAVPALVAPHEAAADSNCWGEYLTDCNPIDPYDPGGWGDTGTGDAGGGGGDAIVDLSSGVVGQPEPEPGPQSVVITAPGQPFVYPADPLMPTETWYSGNGGGTWGSSVSAIAIKAGAKHFLRQPCRKNNGDLPVELSADSTYKVNYTTSDNISASAKGVLQAQVGHQLNSESDTRLGLKVTIPPRQGWTLDVEYQTFTYEITTTPFIGGGTTEYANVVVPTGGWTAVSC
ncbi:hypothetical protein GCM10010441_62930 [Kitasatospora paracochleata]|uniref:Uncharacterized protein n=1 Tax=Kitasatospora paracochleata TaxID=58354 RepID=A0ABT1J326_9ACTN|nr:DUF6426 family protein [Kitasatospora paracochleata]MCP2311841.1 hypothetical protein [Kitasatospora paracochleata]